MLNEYLNTYNLGSHCASTVLMNLCRYNQNNISEDLCFGLGMGLGFSFYKIETMSKYSFSGRSRNLEKNFFKLMGIGSELKYCMDNESVWNDLDIIINKYRRPVVVKLDIGTLDYLKSYFKLTENIDFSEHLATIIGLDSDTAVISEYFRKEPFYIQKSALLRSMNKKFENKSLFNQYYDTYSIPKMQNMVYNLIQAIYINSYQMLCGFGSNLGLPGLKKFAGDVIRFSQLMDFKTMRQNLLFAYLSFEKIGTGGGNFRRMYSRFLNQAAAITKMEMLSDAAVIYQELASLWKKLSVTFFEYSKLDDFSAIFDVKIKKILDEIIMFETKGATMLNSCTAKELQNVIRESEVRCKTIR